jgi:hypothetical protein
MVLFLVLSAGFFLPLDDECFGDDGAGPERWESERVDPFLSQETVAPGFASEFLPGLRVLLTRLPPTRRAGGPPPSNALSNSRVPLCACDALESMGSFKSGVRTDLRGLQKVSREAQVLINN